MTAHDWTLERVAPVPDPGEGEWTLTAQSVSAEGEGVFLFSGPPAPGLPDDRAERRRARRVVISSHGAERAVDVPDAGLRHPLVGLLADGRVLLAQPRRAHPARRRGPRDDEANALTWDPARGEAARFALGDGIEEVLVDRRGRIWVAYFDEGIFGGDPLSRAGVSLFSSDGRLLWQLPPPDTGVAECYALNVADQGAHVLTYTGFPLGSVSPDLSVRWRATPFAGSHAVAVSRTGDLAVFGPQHREPPNRFHLAVLGEAGVAATLALTARAPGGFDGARPVGRGPDLYAPGPEGWHRGSVEDLRTLADAVRPGVPWRRAGRMGWARHDPGPP